MSQPNSPNPETNFTEQKVQNLSFDKNFNVLVVEPLAYDGNNLVRFSASSLGVIDVSNTPVAGVAQDVNITKVSGTAVSLGSKVSAASIPVVIASDQASIPVAATLAAETTKVIGTVNIAASQSIQAVQSGTWNITNVSGTVSLPTGAATSANQTNNLQTTQLVDSGGNAVGVDTNSLRINLQRVNGSTVRTVAIGGNVALTVSLTGTSGETISATGGAVNINSPDSSTTDTVTANAQGKANLTLPGGDSSFVCQVLGTWVGTIQFEVSPDSGTTWYAVYARTSNGVVSQTTTANGLFTGNTAGVTNVRVHSTSWSSGTASIIMRSSSGTSNTNILTPLTISVTGGTASGASLTANPLTTGGLAKTALPTAVSDAQVVSDLLDKFGRPIVMPYGMRDIIGAQSTTITNTTTATTVVSAVASTFSDITLLLLSNISATATECQLSDGTNTYDIYVPAADTRGWSGSVILPATAVNTTWTVKTVTAVTSMKVTAVWVKNR